MATDADTRPEALEEIGLPTDNQRVRYLCSLRPFLARTNLIVTPVVCFIMDPHIVVRASHAMRADVAAGSESSRGR